MHSFDWGLFSRAGEFFFSCSNGFKETEKITFGVFVCCYFGKTLIAFFSGALPNYGGIMLICWVDVPSDGMFCVCFGS